MWESWSQTPSWSPEPGSSVAVVAEEEEAVEDTSDTEVEAEDSSWVVDTVQDTAGTQFCWDTDRQSLDQDYLVLAES